MIGIIGIVAALTVLGLSLIITRIATSALALTGLSREAASFQARSAFTGTGFTTTESESVVNHPVRRRIAKLLMTARSAGIVSIIISLILTFGTDNNEPDKLIRLGFLVVGVVVLWFLAGSSAVDRFLNRIIEWALRRWSRIEPADYAKVLDLTGEYTISKFTLKAGDWLVGKDLNRCRLTEEGVSVLGIHRSDGSYVGVPRGSTELYEGDTLVVYGREGDLKELEQRRTESGDEEHEEAVDRQKQENREQDEREENYEKKRREKGQKESR